MTRWLLEEAMGDKWLADVADAAYWLEQSEKQASQILKDWALIDKEEEENGISN